MGIKSLVDMGVETVLPLQYPQTAPRQQLLMTLCFYNNPEP